MKRLWTLLLIAPLALARPAHAQDKTGGNEPIDPTINVAALTCDYLVDGDLPRDDPAGHKFKTLQAAYEAAPAGTEGKPTVIGIKPNVYALPGGDRGPSLNITRNWITLLGLTNNRRSVVLADNRGHAEGASDNGYILMVNATGFCAKNLTVLNYCNCDYEYPGNPAKNLKMRNPTITQAVALQAEGDKHVYENVAFLSRLDTTFIRTTRAYFKNVYIEGTDDWIGGGQISVWQDCTLVYPTGRGVFSASNCVFLHCTFEAARGFAFYKEEFNGAARPDVLIDCTLPANADGAPVSWVRGAAPPRPSVYSLTYRNKDARGNPAVIRDDTTRASGTACSRELSEEEAKAFNPWNLLRAAPGAAADDWDPAGVKEQYARQGDLVYRMALNNPTPSVRTGGAAATIGATLLPGRAPDQTIRWSAASDLVKLDRTTGPSVTVTGNNQTGEPQWVPIRASAANGFFVTAYAFVEPRYIDPPAITAAPRVLPPAKGTVALQYALDLGGRQDQSVIDWYQCDDAAGANARLVAVSRGNLPLRDYPLTTGDIGKYLRASLAPKHQISDPGKAVFATAEKAIAAADVPTLDLSPDFRTFVVEPTPPAAAYAGGMWTVLGTWTSVTGDNFLNGYGVRAASQGAALLYQQDFPVGDMQIDLVMTPEKTQGMGFGSPGGPEDGDRIQKSDIYIKYDPRTKNGYALRYWRTTRSTEKCVYQFFKIVNGAGTPVSQKQAFTGVFKPSTHLTLKVSGSKISASATNDVDQETLSLEDTIEPSRLGGAGVYWAGSVPRGNSNVYTQFKISYPGAPAPAEATRPAQR